jgi:hypothetical protein
MDEGSEKKNQLDNAKAKKKREKQEKNCCSLRTPLKLTVS